MAEKTTFQEIYDRFFGKITDDMYMEWTREDTEKDLRNLLMDAIPMFEFPRFHIYDFTENSYNIVLTSEEINILASLMYNAWLQRQIASIENIRQKYTGSDFKMTSQANHLAKLLELKDRADDHDHHIQRLYKRRILSKDGKMQSTWSDLRESSALDG